MSNLQQYVGKELFTPFGKGRVVGVSREGELTVRLGATGRLAFFKPWELFPGQKVPAKDKLMVDPLFPVGYDTMTGGSG